eukprot:CAMPEP_0180814924 /NCGR_PEP_ID=MMETSP1038_2-20121128/67331_1 /TAXON_ID=632150 /ORGANISM="Azadinium spinosum, Strain 3D9" /LENGTH=71 /DNA_ID=CAMNT_0022856621 /DNA_START=586 /DNA_END=798 /DNA_ORIENTATION=+
MKQKTEGPRLRLLAAGMPSTAAAARAATNAAPLSAAATGATVAVSTEASDSSDSSIVRTRKTDTKAVATNT